MSERGKEKMRREKKKKKTLCRNFDEFVDVVAPLFRFSRHRLKIASLFSPHKPALRHFPNQHGVVTRARKHLAEVIEALKAALSEWERETRKRKRLMCRRSLTGKKNLSTLFQKSSQPLPLLPKTADTRSSTTKGFRVSTVSPRTSRAAPRPTSPEETDGRGGRGHKHESRSDACSFALDLKGALRAPVPLRPQRKRRRRSRRGGGRWRRARDRRRVSRGQDRQRRRVRRGASAP